jgi:adenosylhomocysteine nucleosidase
MRSSLHQKIIAVTCLSFEARIAATAAVTVVTAARTRRLAGLIEIAAAEGCCGIISFGVAGGLDPRLRPGDWVVATHVIAGCVRYPTDVSWSRRLCGALPSSVHTGISGVDYPIAQPAAKAQLHKPDGTAAVDTESHVAAQVAAAHRIPFVAARVVLDPAHRALPPAALLPLCADGSPDLSAIARSVHGSPRQVGALGLLASDAIRAQSALLLGRRCLGVALGFEGRKRLDVDDADAQRAEKLALAAAQLPFI